MHTQVFEDIASSLTVKSICGPLCQDVRSGSTIAEMCEELDPRTNPNSDPFNNPSRVLDDHGGLLGMIWFHNYAQLDEAEDGNVTVDEIMEPLEPNQLISADTSIFEAVTLFANKPTNLYYVLNRDQVIGVLEYVDLFKPIGRLAFLALALEVEDDALRLCQSGSIRERCWNAIPEGRKRKATELFEMRYGRPPGDKASRFGARDSVKLMACTQLVDKATMIWREKLISSATRAKVLGVFKALKVLRDKCAHPGEHGALIAKENLSEFVIAAIEMRTSLRESMRTYGAWNALQQSI